VANGFIGGRLQERRRTWRRISAKELQTKGDQTRIRGLRRVTRQPQVRLSRYNACASCPSQKPFCPGKVTGCCQTVVSLGETPLFCRPESKKAEAMNGGTGLFNLYKFVAVYYNREQSVPEIQLTRAAGIFRHDNLFFADVLVLANITERF